MTQLVEVEVDHLRLSEDNVRSTTTDAGLESLAQSIASTGLIEPIVVSPPIDGPVRVVHHGARRVLAIDLINKDPAKYAAKPITTVAAVEKVYENDGERIAAALIENLQREDIDPIDEAKGYFRLVNDCAYSQSEIAQRIGRNRSHVSKYLSLLSLPEVAQFHIAEGHISLERAWQLVKLADHPDMIEKLVDEATGAVNQYKIDEALTKVETKAALATAAKRIEQSTDVPVVYSGHPGKPKSDKPFAPLGKSGTIDHWDGTVPEGTSYVQLTKEPWQDEVSVKFFTNDEDRIDTKVMGYEDRRRYEDELRKRDPDAVPAQHEVSDEELAERRKLGWVGTALTKRRQEHEQARLAGVLTGKLTLATLVELAHPLAMEAYYDYGVDPALVVKVGRIKLPGVADVDDTDVDELADKLRDWGKDPANKARFTAVVLLVLSRHDESVAALLDQVAPPFDDDAVRAELERDYDNLQALESTGTED
jgi:ParB/RepB/Spo0J family partition protein